MSAVLESPVRIRALAKVSIIRGLLWREWMAQGTLLKLTAVTYLVLEWVFIVFVHPGFVLALGTLLAIAAGPNWGGDETAEGSEEFGVALPPTRRQRYLTRMLFGLGVIVALTVGGVVAIALDLPPRLWGLVVESGYNQPFPAVKPVFLYPLAIAAPVATFAIAFTLASAAHGRGLVGWSAIISAPLAGVVTGLSLYAEHRLWNELNGWITVPALAVLAVAMLITGHFVYVRKEISAQTNARSLILPLVVVVVVLVVVAGLFVA